MVERLYALHIGSVISTDPDPDPDPDPIDITGSVTSSYGTGPQTVANPAQGTGQTLLFVCCGLSPGETPSGSWTSPTGSFDVDEYVPSGGSFVPRARYWYKDDEGEADFTFGWSGTSLSQNCIIIPLDGTVSAIGAAAGNFNVSSASSLAFPVIATDEDDLVILVAIGQRQDDFSSGPGDPVYNDSSSTDRHTIAVHKVRATADGTTTPGGGSWSGTVAGKIHASFFARGDSLASNVKLPSSEWTAYQDPDEPDSWNQNRTKGQLRIMGQLFQAGATTDSQPGTGGFTGYGNSWGAVAPNELHGGFNMQSGESKVLGAETAPAGAGPSNLLVARLQWLDGNGYDESQETPGGLNHSTAWPGTHRTFKDGTRCQYNLIPVDGSDPIGIKASFNNPGNAREFVMVGARRIEDWMVFGADDNASWEIHSPDVTGTSNSPYIEFIGDGFLRIDTRDRTTPWDSSGSSISGTRRADVAITGGDVGDLWATFVRGKLDPTQGFLEVWLKKGSGQWAKIVDVTGGWGWAWADGDSRNGLFYAVGGPRFYSWHRFTNDPTNAPDNWDPGYPEREMAIGGYYLRTNPTRPNADYLSHGAWIVEGAS